MFFRKWIYNLYNNRFSFKINETNKLVLKSLLVNSDFPFIYRLYFFNFLKKYNLYSSSSFFRRACLVSGYPKSVFRFFKMTRHFAKRYASMGLLVGMRKSSF